MGALLDALGGGSARGNPASGRTQLRLVSAIALRHPWSCSQAWTRAGPGSRWTPFEALGHPHIFGLCLVPRMCGCAPHPALSQSSRPGRGARWSALQPPSTSPLVVREGGPLLASSTSPRALGTTPKSPPGKVLEILLATRSPQFRYLAAPAAPSALQARAYERGVGGGMPVSG